MEPRSPMEPEPILYSTLADWFHLLTRPEDYAEEAAIFARTIRELRPDARTLLELGSGGGNNASHLKRAFSLTLTDRSPEMLAVSRRLNPDLEHIQGDMRAIRLGRTFDAVFVHDAVMYLTAAGDLRAMLATARAHLHPGGIVLIVPDCTKETYRDSTICGGHDGEDVTPRQPGRALRYLSWSHDSDPGDTEFVTDFAYLLREGAGPVRCLTDRHVQGLFSRSDWLALIRAAGFQAGARPFGHSEVAAETEIFFGVATGQAHGTDGGRG